MTIEEVLDTLEVQAWTARPDGALDFVNTYTARYFGMTRERLIGEGWQNVLHGSDVPIAVERWTHAVKTGEPYEVEFRLLQASDRTYRWHRASARRVATPDGDRWVGTNVDIDGEKRRAEVLAAWREQASSRK